tara:strand:+ start:2466 stop:2879 length:414 start_codon:yes stop_codon:yes gene_type:complete
MSNDGNKQASYWEERALVGGRGSGSVGGVSYPGGQSIKDKQAVLSRYLKKHKPKDRGDVQNERIDGLRKDISDMQAGRKAGEAGRKKIRKAGAKATKGRNLARKALGARPQKKTVAKYKRVIRAAKKSKAGSKPKSK